MINRNSRNIVDPIDRAIEMYRYHPRIILIKEKVDNQNKFSFEQVSLCDIVQEIKNINPKKSSIIDSILLKVLKISSETTANVLQNLLNESLEIGIFPDNLKLADIILVFKKRDPLDKTNEKRI